MDLGYATRSYDEVEQISNDSVWELTHNVRKSGCDCLQQQWWTF